jgi:hypothetical protein
MSSPADPTIHRGRTLVLDQHADGRERDRAQADLAECRATTVPNGDDLAADPLGPRVCLVPRDHSRAVQRLSAYAYSSPVMRLRPSHRLAICGSQGEVFS